ncbi:MFS transporter [Sphaerisporangium flaviroseum]|uniref:MFS transporter n=1 Tax=Sphaerisporangium flaviroseum TaxID=509199 RepID=A0ABP7HJJ4_9ACTN
MFTPYRRLLAQPGVPRLFITGLIVKLGTPVLSLALLLAAVDRLGSYATAGLVLTGHALALALCAPFGGRIADRYGPRPALTGYLVTHTLAYAFLLLAPPALMIGAAVLLGATTPPVGPVIRGAWPHLVPTASLPAAYAVDNAVNELSFIAGPLLVPVLSWVIPAQGVVAAAGAAVLLGTALLLTVPAIGPSAPAPPGKFRLAGPLTHRRTLLLLTIAAFGTFTFGCLRIATVASATTLGSASFAGVLMSLLSVGALLGTLGYGARAWPIPGGRLLVLLSLAEGAVLLGGGWAPGFLTLAVLITLVGLVTGPRDAVVPTLLAEHATGRYRTEVFAWLNTFMWAGYGLGTALAGRLTGPHDTGSAAFAAAAAAAVAGAILATVANRIFSSQPAPAQMPAEGPSRETDRIADS